MNKLDVFVSLAFRILPDNGGNIPFNDILNNPKKILPKKDEGWEIVGKLNHQEGIPFQSYKFQNNVVINIQPDFAEIRQDAMQGEEVTLENINKIAESFAGIAIKNNIQHMGLNYAFIIKDEKANIKLNAMQTFKNTEPPTQTGYKLIYSVSNKIEETINITIDAGSAAFQNQEIKGIIFNSNYNKLISDDKRMRSVLDFVSEEEMNNIFKQIKEKSLKIADNL